MRRHFVLGAILALVFAENGSPKQGPPAPASSTPAQAITGPRPAPARIVSPEALAGTMRRGIEFLLRDQNKDGSWGSAARTKDLNIYAPVPAAHQAFRAAVTALCVCALIETGGSIPAVPASLDRAEKWLLANLPDLRRSSADALYNIWAHSYGIQALVRMHGRSPTDLPRRSLLESQIRQQMEFLARFESVDGGWGYYDDRAGSKRPAADSTSFMNAAVLIALYEAKGIGIKPPERLVKRAIDATLRQRKPDFSYLYGEYLKYRPMNPINRPGGSLGRSQCCNAALRLWGDKKVTDQVLKVWLDRLFARNLWLDMGRKRPIPHESHFAVAGYFFYYGHYYAGLCIDLLPAAERPFYQDHLANVLLPLQEKNGSWWDFPLYNYHEQYGTAFALLALKRCQRHPVLKS